jgi:hypothetical protein
MAHAAARHSGKSLLAQAVEIARLALGPGQIRPAEYYAFRLYDDGLLSFAAKRRFLGERAQIALNQLCNQPAWRAIADDKLIFADAMRGHGFPVPETIAIYHPFRSLGSGISLATPQDLADFLRRAELPLFAKPVAGMFSAGAARLEQFDAGSSRLLLAGIGWVPLAEFHREVEYFARRFDGYLFQRLLHPHERVEAICGDRIANLRFVILLERNGPRILRTLWKIPAGPHVADNFWRAGNLLASLDPATGRVVRVVCGSGPDRTLPERHPDSGAEILGAVHPNWQEMRALCLDAAACLPGLRIQAWDIALCRQGPVLQEVNVGGSYRLQQVADEKGMLDDDFRGFLDREVPAWRRRAAWLALRRSIAGRVARRRAAGG